MRGDARCTVVGIRHQSTERSHLAFSLPRVSLTPIGEVAYELRYLYVERRRALRESRSGSARAVKRWRLVAGRYDRLLLQAAEMLDVPGPRPPKERPALDTREWKALERALAEAGLDVSADADRRVAG